MEPVLHPETKRELSNYLSRPKHAIGLFGQPGVGKSYLAMFMAGRMLETDVSENTPGVYIVRPEKSRSITIEQARGLINFMKLTGLKKEGISRVAIIENANLLTTEAQNALLKTLEEPPADAVLILTATHKASLLPTINSRLESIEVKNPVQSDTIAYFTNKYQGTVIESKWLIAGGRAGLLDALLANDEHELLPYIELAKKLLGMNQFERLTQVDKLTKLDTGQLLDALNLISSTGFRKALEKGNEAHVKRWHRVQKATFAAEEDLRFSPNSKLLMTNLMLQI